MPHCCKARCLPYMLKTDLLYACVMPPCLTSLVDKVLKQIGISGLRVYVTGQNLFIITKYKGYYPELDSFGQGTNNQAVNAGQSPSLYSIGVDAGAYPAARTYYSRCECSIINFLNIIL